MMNICKWKFWGSTVALTLILCGTAAGQSANGSLITSPANGQQFPPIQVISVEGLIKAADVNGYVVTTWPTGQVTTATVTYGQGNDPEVWQVLHFIPGSKGLPSGNDMPTGVYESQLRDTKAPFTVWDTTTYEVVPLPPPGGSGAG